MPFFASGVRRGFSTRRDETAQTGFHADGTICGAALTGLDAVLRGLWNGTIPDDSGGSSSGCPLVYLAAECRAGPPHEQDSAYHC